MANDFDDLKPIQIGTKDKIRQMYSPMAKGEIRGKRRSLRMKEDDTVSEGATDSPKKVSSYTRDTFFRVSKNSNHE